VIGPVYQPKAVSAVLGPAHSPNIPDTLWGAWIDSGLTVLGMTGASHEHSEFSENASGVENAVIIDGGDLPAGTIAYFGLTDSASGGEVVVYATVDLTGLSAGDPVAFPIGALTFPYTEA